MKRLPGWDELLKNYPNKEAKNVFTDIGGKVKLNYDIGILKTLAQPGFLKHRFFL